MKYWKIYWEPNSLLCLGAAAKKKKKKKRFDLAKDASSACYFVICIKRTLLMFVICMGDNCRGRIACVWIIKVKPAVFPKVPSQHLSASWQLKKPQCIQMSHAGSSSRTRPLSIPALMVQYDVLRCNIKSSFLRLGELREAAQMQENVAY